MPAVSLFFQVHQPFRLYPYKFFDIGSGRDYVNEYLNKEILDRIADNCYLPANEMLLDLMEKTGDAFKVTFSISGTALEQFEKFRPDVLESFQDLARTGNVEFLGETYYHSLSFFYDKNEFSRQVAMHTEAIEKVFGQTPKIFRNTELACQNEMIRFVSSIGFKGLVTEGLEWFIPASIGHPNAVFGSKVSSKMAVLLRNHTLSNDIGYRYTDTEWKKHPLTSRKFTNWLNKEPGDIVNLYLDYEAIGEHHKETTGIFEFFKKFVIKWASEGEFVLPSKSICRTKPQSQLDIYSPISWADTERDLSAWNGNPLQKAALKRVYEMGDAVRQSDNTELLEWWSLLQSSDHFYYMSTKQNHDARVHSYFSPYNTPYDAYVYYTNILSDMELRIQRASEGL